MQKRRNWSVKQRFCGFMAFMVMFIYVFNHTSISLFFAASSGGTGTPSDAVRESGITLRNCPEEEVELWVMSDCTGYEAGDFVCLDVYIKNNSGEMITDGELRYRAKGIREETAYFEDPDGDYEGQVPDRMTGLRIGPGESRHVTFCFDIDEEIDKTKNQKVDFAFSWEKEGRTAKAKRTFCYVAGGMNLLLPEIHNQDGDDPEGRTWFWAGEPGQMTLHFDLGKILEIIEDKLENEDVIASSSDADIASGSDADIASGSDADKDYDSDMDVAGGSNAVTASGSDAQKDKVHGSGAVIASSSNAWVKWEGDSVLGGEKPVLKELSCKVETYGLQLDQFHVDERMTNADYSTGTRCSFKISRDAKLGIYYGTVTATYEMKGREYTSTQGFAIQVGEGEDQEVVRVIRLIDELPEPEEIEEILTGFEEAGDEAGYEAYYAGLYEQVMYVYYEYQALTQEQKERVYNRDKLLAFEWLWGAAMALEEGSWEWLVEEIKKGGTQTITLTKDIEKPADAELPVTIPGGADITLDLNGKTLSCTSSDSSKNMFEVEASGQFTITDHSLSSAPETTAAERYGDWNEAKAAIENMSHYDPDTKTATYGVISRVSREDQSIRLDRHQVDMSKVGAIEGTDVDNIINVKSEGKLFIKGGRLTSLGKSQRAVFGIHCQIYMTGGYIVGNETDGNGGGINITNWSTLEITGGSIINNKAHNNIYTNKRGGGAVYGNGLSKITIGKDAVIAGNSAPKGGAVYVEGKEGESSKSSVTIDSGAIIAGNIAEGNGGGIFATANSKVIIKGGEVTSNFAQSGGGIYVAPAAQNGSSVQIDGGTISRNHACYDIKESTFASVGGGGILAGGDVTMTGGTILENYAEEGGGGILVWYKWNTEGHESISVNTRYCPKFIMEGGTIKGNEANQREGGGIRCEGKGLITGGSIIGNITNTTYDFGGGGIYIDLHDKNQPDSGRLEIRNAIITNNMAKGYGGGIAGCGKSTIDVFTIDGAAIYENEALGEVTQCGQGNAGDQLVTFENYPQFFQNPDGGMLDKGEIAKDYFCVGQSKIFNLMLGGGFHNWRGSANQKHVTTGDVQGYEKSNPIRVLFHYSGVSNPPKGERGVAGLISAPSSDHISKAEAQARVRISDNISGVHGGGIACNGILILGESSDINNSTGRLRIVKNAVGGEYNTDKKFTFTVTFKDNTGTDLPGKYPYFDIDSNEGTIGSGDTVTLKDGEYIAIRDLPGGTTYTVKETEDPEYKDVDIEVEDGNKEPADVPGRNEYSGTIAAGTDNLITLTFINRKEDVGKLRIEKQVEGENKENAEFQFEVYFTIRDNEPLKGHYQYRKDGKGKPEKGVIKSGDTIGLESGQYIEIQDLPEGTKYRIVEQKYEDYETDIQVLSGSSGSISKKNIQEFSGIISAVENTVKVTFINRKKDTGRLSIAKNVTGEGDLQKRFRFRVNLFTDGTELKNHYPYSCFREGKLFRKGTIKSGSLVELANGENIEIKDLPEGTKYTVIEEVYNDYETSVQVTEGDKTPVPKGAVREASGTIAAGTHNNLVTLTYTNQKKNEEPKPEHGNLTLSKKVTGDGDTNKNFHFKVTLKSPDGKLLPGEYDYAGSISGTIKNGEAEVALGHGQSITIKDLPVGTKYDIQEREANTEGYITAVENSQAGNAVVSGNQSVVFKNHKEPPSRPTKPEEPSDPPSSPPEPSSPTDPWNPTDPTSPTDFSDPTPPSEGGTAPDDDPPPSSTAAPSESATPAASTAPTSTVPEEASSDPEIPVLPELPDPNDPDSPDWVIIVEEGVPRTYVKVWDPKEKTFIYIPEEEVPLFGLPRMGEVGRNLMNCAVWLAFLGGAGAVTLYRSKKEREEDGKEHGPSEGLH